MLGLTAPVVPAPALPTPPTAPDPPRAGARTMMGVAVPGVAPRSAEPPPPAPRGGALRGSGTILGVAIPGIAPVAPGHAPAPAPAPPPPAAPRVPLGGATVAMPSRTTTAAVPIVPAPPPFVDEPAPEAPPKRAPKGVPIGIVAGLIGGLVLVGGGAIAFFHRSAPPIVAQPRLDALGNEVLHLRCENCPDGTAAVLGGSKATFQSSEADLPLTKPLEVGDNKLSLSLERPGVGRDETVKLVVPVAFRIRADLADIDKTPPVITVRVAAAPGSEVKIDGKPVALDGSGHGAYAVDVSKDTEGATDELRAIDRKIPYAVAEPGGKPETGVVSARIGVVPLRIDAPGARAVVEGGSFTLAGQTAPGGAVTVDGAPVAVQADGSFAASRPTGAPGASVAVAVRATAAGRAPRTAHVTVKRGSLEAEAQAQEAAGGLLTYDQIAGDIASKAGQRAVVSGEVLESRVTGHQAIALVSDTRACKSGPCLARVIAGEDAKIARGSKVRAYGTVTRAVSTSTGKSIPEIAADFVAKGQ